MLLPDLGCAARRGCPVGRQSAPVTLSPWFVFFQDRVRDRPEKESSSGAPGALRGLCPAGGGVQAPAFENRFVHSLSELLDSLSPSSALRGLRVYALDILVHGGVRVVLCRFTQKCAECFLAEVRAVYGEAFLLCPEIVISVLPGGRAGTDGICLCPTSKLCFESVWVPVGAIFCYSKQNV